MSENLKNLLEKINKEGIKQAEENARLIEAKAKSDAEKIIEDAKKRADRIIHEAEITAEKTRVNSEADLKQASRNFLLSLKEEVRAIFNKIIHSEIKKIITYQETAGIISGLIEKFIDKNGQISDIKILVKKEDLEKIKHVFISKLKDRIRDGIEFRPIDAISTGFYISFDKGRSYFDFSDEALVEALAAYLNPELANLIK